MEITETVFKCMQTNDLYQTELLVLDNNTWNLWWANQMSCGLFKIVTYKLSVYKLYIFDIYIWTFMYKHGVIVIVVGNGHGDTSSNPGRDWLHFT